MNSSLKMEASISSELLGPTYRSTPYRTPEEQSVTFLLRPEFLIHLNNWHLCLQLAKTCSSAELTDMCLLSPGRGSVTQTDQASLDRSTDRSTDRTADGISPPDLRFLKYENSYRQVGSRSASRRIPRCLYNLRHCRILPAHAISLCVFEIRLNVILPSIPRGFSGGATRCVFKNY